MKIIHMIGNAHIDPVWLWDIADGVDTTLATARSACDRLDEYPDFIFTCSTMWFHQVIERLDPELFERVKSYVSAERWQLTGGMVIQPDCNLPSAESFRQQFNFGQRYYLEKFGRITTVGYNVDSFGHTAYLPTYMRQAGIDSYVFMRPMKHEKTLPANLFRWQSPSGDEVLAFRISFAYSTNDRHLELRNVIDEILCEIPAGIDHAMCFYGVGDHGGGPTKKQIEWIIENTDAIAGVQLKFSHPRAFFDAVAVHREQLPVIRGELQHHAIGCYSVERKIKDGMLAAEKSLLNACAAITKFSNCVTSADIASLNRAQHTVMFNQFHDILGGTCMENSNRQAAGELFAADATAREIFTSVTRRAMRKLAQPGVHKIIAYNANNRDYSGPIVHHPWLQFRDSSTLQLFDGDRPVAFQRIKAEGVIGICKIIWNDTIPAGTMKVYRLAETRDDGPENHFSNSVFKKVATDEIMLTLFGRSEVRVMKDKILIGDVAVYLRVFDDPTDTWSHSAIDTFSTDVAGDFSWDITAREIDRGEISTNFACFASHDKSRVVCEVCHLAGENMLRLNLNVTWGQVRQRLGLVVELNSRIIGRTDLVSGGPLEREVNSCEYPLAGMTCVKTADGGLSVIAPTVTSLSMKNSTATFTLLRSPYMAHHDPAPADNIPRSVTDQGSHNFEIGILMQPISATDMFAIYQAFNNPPITWDMTG